MQKAIWVLAIVCCLSTIILTVAITHADSPPAVPNELKAKAFVLVNEKSETMATLVGNALGGGVGFSLVVGKEDDVGITFMRATSGALIISASDGHHKSRADILLDTDGSNSFVLSGPGGSVSAGVNAISPYINLQNADRTYFNLHTHNGMLFSGKKESAELTTKPSLEIETTTKTSKE